MNRPDPFERRMDKTAARRQRRNTRDVVRATQREYRYSQQQPKKGCLNCAVIAFGGFAFSTLYALAVARGWL
jgi:hypothetical protein